jgi:ribonucleoside-diphosphate reductase alpha chain
MTTEIAADETRDQQTTQSVRTKSTRRRLADTRRAITHKFSISGYEGYITVGLYEDESPGEVFIKTAKQGSTLSGLVDTIAVLTSLALQYGVPVADLARKLTHTRFEPSGHTTNPDIKTATSISDYIFRWLDLRFKDTCSSFEKEPVEASNRGGEELQHARD